MPALQYVVRLLIESSGLAVAVLRKKERLKKVAEDRERFEPPVPNRGRRKEV